jgi:quercetin dioxygenase-like cupin family protein|tara:strand:+ start:1020 stop:1178 length:159 start_codon:yes stop_codon:yes gene_type:complete
MHNTIPIKPEKGKIIIFPDDVEHRVNAHGDDEERITLAFNYRKCNMWNGIEK